MAAVAHERIKPWSFYKDTSVVSACSLMCLWEVVADGALCGHTAIVATLLRLVSFTPINLVFYFWFKLRCKRGTKVKGHSNLQVSCTNNRSWPRENMMTVTGKIFKLGTSLKKKKRIQSLKSTPCQTRQNLRGPLYKPFESLWAF